MSEAHTADGQQYLYLTTIGWKSGQAHQIEIWYVYHAGRYYLVAETGERAHWVQNIRHNPAITFQVGSAQFTGTGRAVDRSVEPELADAVAALMDAKYDWSDGLIVELASA
jgi:deazaflavin-dependent oxidoreductase (nitroreductase family)